MAEPRDSGVLAAGPGGGNHLGAWLEEVEGSGLAEIRVFARGVRQDEAAARMVVSLPWPNGQIGGRAHGLKMLKRQMFGRAGFDLLRRRVLGSARQRRRRSRGRQEEPTRYSPMSRQVPYSLESLDVEHPGPPLAFGLVHRLVRPGEQGPEVGAP